MVTAQPAAETQIALLPLEDAAMDGDVRAALGALPGIALQESSVTGPEVRSAQELGLNCVWDDAACLARLAILLRVQTLLSARAADGQLELVAVSSEGTTSRRASAALEPDRAAAIARITREVLGLPAAALLSVVTRSGYRIKIDDELAGTAPLGAVALEAGEHTIAVLDPSGKTVDDMQVLMVEGESREVRLGIPKGPIGDGVSPTLAIAVVGGGVFAVGMITALSLEATLSLSDAGSFDDRKAMQTTEQVFLLVAGAGFVAGAVGGGLWAAQELQ
jgi:hypothetical protein